MPATVAAVVCGASRVTATDCVGSVVELMQRNLALVNKAFEIGKEPDGQVVGRECKECSNTPLVEATHWNWRAAQHTRKE